MQIHGFNKTTLLDFPGHLASTVFTGGCNMRCPYCQNADLVLNPMSQPLISEEVVFDHIKKRKGIIEGVCITGGEPTLQADLEDFIKRLKELGVMVKLDSNGYRPEVLKRLMGNGLLDYVAMDIKSSLDDYHTVAGVKLDTSLIKESIDLLKNGPIDYEFRTTVVKELHSKETFEKIGELLSGAKQYFLQGYIDSERVIERRFSSYTKEELETFVAILKKTIKNVSIRGVD
ncbi:MAG: anaerobic ribonucleoside-triphosphate reductase activating protein [Lachnospiraceae bacterium]|nr:anaerobic ribonucleoside-triphosphate reductase activating protein [Lachnospiraceae bacterium]